MGSVQPDLAGAADHDDLAETRTPFSCKEEPIENQRPLKVRVIGAGFSGIYLGIRIPQRLRNIDLKIYEKNDGLGGTWWENRYPGCACDIPAHSYQFTFAPNKKWSGFYSTSQEIRDYIGDVAEKYGANRFVKLQHKVVGCAWDDVKKQWHISVTRLDTGNTFEEDVDILVAARGNLNEPRWPSIPGLESFKGEKMHSAAWNENYDFHNKKIAVIGGGSSSIQIVPELRKVEGTKLSVFGRHKTWITNRFGDYIMGQMGWDIHQLTISDERKEEWEKDEAAYLKFRKILDDDGNMVHYTTQKGSGMQTAFAEVFSEVTGQLLAKRGDLLPHFSPDFGLGCRRITPGPGYLEALCEDNVDFITDEIDSINETGLVVNGRQVDVDVVVCATGFVTSAVPPFPVTGKGGVELAHKFSPFPQTYLTVAVDAFPNYFIMMGPNSGIGAGSLNPVIEAEGDYIIKCIRKLQREDYVSMAPKRARVEDFSDYVGEYFKRTVYMDDCKSWYKTGDGKGDRISALWPGSLLHLMETLRAPRWEDYDFESKEQNRLRWLGNGFSICLTGGGDPSFYLNPDQVDIPPVEAPETDERYKRRPFSH